MFNICVKHLSLKALGCVPVKVITVFPLQFFFFFCKMVYFIQVPPVGLYLLKNIKKIEA
jgi:hypothetical protein